MDENRLELAFVGRVTLMQVDTRGGAWLCGENYQVTGACTGMFKTNDAAAEEMALSTAVIGFCDTASKLGPVLSNSAPIPLLSLLPGCGLSPVTL